MMAAGSSSTRGILRVLLAPRNVPRSLCSVTLDTLTMVADYCEGCMHPRGDVL